MSSPRNRYAPAFPTSPTSRRASLVNGFRPSPRPKPRPIEEMTLRELRDVHNLNAKILASPGASTSTYVHRITAEQAAVAARIFELEGMETINTGLKNTRIIGEDDMNIDIPAEPPVSRAIEAKRKALSQFGAESTSKATGTMSLQEAMELERQAHVQDLERQKRAIEKKKRLGLPIQGEVLTRAEREARIWAFMNHKPSDSDMEDDDDDDDDEDPAAWFEDDQDDGRKGQDIVEPDVEDLANFIRVDESRVPYMCYSREDGD
ncbi:hypothetical protein BDN72DRAFT_831477 [Pluteus cervinus]|uniref:Uncharacterized protein n=1 Tax=Pluteus cervinus TaxID=181527 RepID=A0ACD3BEJ7_9AGAR|nr:hypothetical protein BDN72DRAFT_831477 [Pluteus cervinus]